MEEGREYDEKGEGLITLLLALVAENMVAILFKVPAQHSLIAVFTMLMLREAILLHGFTNQFL